jgi:hypothetical protein
MEEDMTANEYIKSLDEEPHKKKEFCSICNSEYSEDAGGIKGEFGIMPVVFCEWCFSSIMDMAEQMREPEPCGMSHK